MVKNNRKYLEWLLPLVPVIAWMLVLVWPQFSLANQIQKLYQLSPNEARAIDIAFFCMLSTYSLKIMDSLLSKVDKLQSVIITTKFEPENKRDPYTILDPPEGSPKRVSVIIEVTYNNKFIHDYIITRPNSPLFFHVEYLGRWLTVGVENIDDGERSTIKIMDNYIQVDLLKVTKYPSGKIRLKLSLVTRGIETTEGHLTGKVVGWKKIFIKFEECNHKLILNEQGGI